MKDSNLDLAASRDEERARRLDARLDTERALREPVIEPVARAGEVHDPRWLRLLDRIRPGHSLTPYACRLPSGDLGRTAIQFLNGEWDCGLRARSSRSRGRLTGSVCRVTRAPRLRTGRSALLG